MAALHSQSSPAALALSVPFLSHKALYARELSDPLYHTHPQNARHTQVKRQKANAEAWNPQYRMRLHRPLPAEKGPVDLCSVIVGMSPAQKILLGKVVW